MEVFSSDDPLNLSKAFFEYLMALHEPNTGSRFIKRIERENEGEIGDMI